MTRFDIRCRAILMLSIVTVSAYAQDGSFTTLFKFERTIAVDSTIYVAMATGFAVTDEGRMIVLDRFDRKAYLLSPTGTLIRQIGPPATSSSRTGLPMCATACGDGSFLVVWGYAGTFRFSRDGEYMGVLDTSFFPAPSICSDVYGNIYALYHEENLGPCVKCDYTGASIKSFGAFPDGYASLIKRVWGGGIVSDQSGNVYVAYPTSNEITKYDSALNKIMTIRHDSRLYRQPDKIPARFPTDRKTIMSIVEPALKGKSVVASLDLLTSSTLVLQYYTGSQVCLQLFDLSGHYLLRDDIIAPALITGFHNSRAYMVREDGRNKLIDVYRYY